MNELTDLLGQLIFQMFVQWALLMFCMFCVRLEGCWIFARMWHRIEQLGVHLSDKAHQHTSHFKKLRQNKKEKHSQKSKTALKQFKYFFTALQRTFQA
jgi:hypothetical protein